MTYLALPKLSKDDKKKLAWGAAGALVIATGIAMGRRKKKPKKKPDYGIRVNALCSEFTVTDVNKLRLTQQQIYQSFIDRGISDPWTITSAFVAKVAPQCKRPTAAKKPREMRSPGEALFYYAAFTDTLCALLDRKILTPESAIAEGREAQGWAIEQGVEPSEPALADPECALNELRPGDDGGGPPSWLQCTGGQVPYMVAPDVWECGCPPGTTLNAEGRCV